MKTLICENRLLLLMNLTTLDLNGHKFVGGYTDAQLPVLRAELCVFFETLWQLPKEQQLEAGNKLFHLISLVDQRLAYDAQCKSHKQAQKQWAIKHPNYQHKYPK